MERKKQVMQEKKSVWKKTTPGTLYPIPRDASRAARKGETFEATEEELGKYINEFELVEKAELMNTEEGKQEALREHESQYKLVETDGGYNVIGEDDEEPVNEAPLNIDEATAMKDTLDREDIAAEASEENEKKGKATRKKGGKKGGKK